MYFFAFAADVEITNGNILIFTSYVLQSNWEMRSKYEKWTTKQSIDPIKICKRNEAEVLKNAFKVAALNHKLTTQMKYDC